MRWEFAWLDDDLVHVLHGLLGKQRAEPVLDTLVQTPSPEHRVVPRLPSERKKSIIDCLFLGDVS